MDAGGTCTIVASAGSRTARAQAPAQADATTTWCDPLTIAVGALGSGRWTYQVTYRSAEYSGITGPVTVDVP